MILFPRHAMMVLAGDVGEQEVADALVLGLVLSPRRQKKERAEEETEEEG